jgi:hypothetical protein
MLKGGRRLQLGRAIKSVLLTPAKRKIDQMCETWILVLGGALIGGGGVMTMGGLWKLRQPAMFRAVLRSQGIRRPWLTTSVFVTVPLVELVIGCAAIVDGVVLGDHSLRWTALGLAIVGTSFFIYVLVNIGRGVKTACGCLNADDSFGLMTALRSGFIAAIGWTAAGAATEMAGVESAPCAGSRLMLGILTTVVLVVGPRPFARASSRTPTD